MNWKNKLRQTFQDSTVVPEDDILEELAQHLETRYNALVATGYSALEAEQALAPILAEWKRSASLLVRRRKQLPAPVASPSASSWMTHLLFDLKYAIRILLRQKRFAAITILMLGIGIAATATLFSVTYGVLATPLPWPDADRLVSLEETRGGSPPRIGSFTNNAYYALATGSSSFEQVAAWNRSDVTLLLPGGPERVHTAIVSGGLFNTLEAAPLLGRLLGPTDEAGKNVVISESLWMHSFDGDPHVLGRSISFDREQYTVVGILPDRQAFPDTQIQAWTPRHVANVTAGGLAVYNAIARLKSGIDIRSAAAEATARAQMTTETGLVVNAIFGRGGRPAILITPLRDTFVGEVRRPLLILLAAVLVLLLAAIANVASLQLARATTRAREIAIRSALGATMTHLVRQLIAEGLVIASAGCALGIVCAALLGRLMPAILPSDFPRANSVSLNLAAVLVAAAISLVAALAFGIVPALYMRGRNLGEALTAGGPRTVGAHSTSTGRGQTFMMVAQVGAACLLLVFAALLSRTFLALLHADRGFDPAHVITVRLTLPDALFDYRYRYTLLTNLIERISNSSGTIGVAFTSENPLTKGGSVQAFTLPVSGLDGSTTVEASPRMVSAKYFFVIGAHILAGRGFGDSDTETSLPVIVVNRTFASRYLGSQAVGKKLPATSFGRQAQWTVVGVVDDARYVQSPEPTQPEIFYNYRQIGPDPPAIYRHMLLPVAHVLVRTELDAPDAAELLRSEVRAVDPKLVPEGLRSLDESISIALARPRLYAILLGAFALVAVTIAATGLFALLSYLVAQRSPELALRIALGADRRAIVSLVFRAGALVTAIGIVSGTLISLAAARSLSAMLFGVKPADPLTYILTPVALFGVTVLACAPPALRASRVDPANLLR